MMFVTSYSTGKRAERQQPLVKVAGPVKERYGDVAPIGGLALRSLDVSAHQDVTLLTDSARSFVLTLIEFASPKSSSPQLRRNTP